MKTPFLVISYGQFVDTKKILSYDLDGIHSLPLFTDTSYAIRFIRGMHRVLREFQDDRKLTTQLCTEPQHALDALTTMVALAPDLQQVVWNADPPAPVVEFALDGESKQQIMPLEDLITDLQ